MKGLYAFFLLLLCASAHAEDPKVPPQRDPADELYREQLERERERALKRAPTQIQAPIPLADTYGDDIEDLPESGPTFLIHAIKLQGGGLLLDEVTKQIAAPFTGKPMGVNRINLLLGRLNRELVRSGYITSRAYVAQQSIAESVLLITVVPGLIEEIIYNGQSIKPQEPGYMGIRLSLPMKTGDVLKLPDIEQAVDQFNRLRRNNVQVQIIPGSKPGGSIIQLTNAQSDTSYYTLSTDNLGSETTGIQRLQTSIEMDDALGLMELLSLGLISSLDTNAIYGTISLPSGYNTFSVMASRSEYQNLIGDTALVYGTSSNVTFSANRLIHRDQNTKTTVGLSLSKRLSERMVNNATLTPQKMTVARTDINRFTRFTTGTGIGQWSVNAGLAAGLPGWGADRDPANISPQAAHAQFAKVEMSGSATIPLKNSFSWKAAFNSQLARTPLYSSEQIFMGGVSSVRGLPESALGGDRGFYLRNEIVREIITSLMGDRMRMEPYVALDGGSVESVADHRWQSVLGLGMGARINISNASVEINLGWPIKKPSELADAADAAY